MRRGVNGMAADRSRRRSGRSGHEVNGVPNGRRGGPSSRDAGAGEQHRNSQMLSGNYPRIAKLPRYYCTVGDEKRPTV